MSWCGVEGHDEVVDRFRTSLFRGRLASTFLFVGRSGIGKRLFARRLAQALLCEQSEEAKFQPCLACNSCVQIEAESHPDVEVVGKPSDKSFIPIKTFIGDREHRNQEGLCHRISLKPSQGNRRIAIIDDADHLNHEGANCLLKTLEEPPPNAVLILIGTSEQTQLPTIRSRCQTIRFRPLEHSFIQQYLVNQNLATDANQAAELSYLSEGSLDQAIEFSDQALSDFREELWTTIGQDSDIDSVSLAKVVSSFVDGAGKEAPKRRQRLRHVIRLFLMVFRHQLFQTVDAPPPSQGRLEQVASPLSDSLTESVQNRIDRCLLALGEVDANANLATLIECWIDELYASPA
ncbi:MAG: DNA polymerase III subunit [Pirellulaceae bacterium]|nr:DNA polymerase III subunit [Pirellulaceae bacterium]